MIKNLIKSAVVAATAVAASAHAAIDTTAVVTEIQGVAAPAAAIGGAVLIVLVGIKAFKMVRRAM